MRRERSLGWEKTGIGRREALACEGKGKWRFSRDDDVVEKALGLLAGNMLSMRTTDSHGVIVARGLHS